MHTFPGTDPSRLVNGTRDLGESSFAKLERNSVFIEGHGLFFRVTFTIILGNNELKSDVADNNINLRHKCLK